MVTFIDSSTSRLLKKPWPVISTLVHFTGAVIRAQPALFAPRYVGALARRGFLYAADAVVVAFLFQALGAQAIEYALGFDFLATANAIAVLLRLLCSTPLWH
jgi:hypothetical protein